MLGAAAALALGSPAPAKAPGPGGSGPATGWAAPEARGNAPAGAIALARPVPFVAQDPELCGGACLAMVLRYWGATGVYAGDYRSLVDGPAGGIRTGDLLAAARAPGWRAAAFPGTPGTLRDQLARERPVIALIQAGAGRYHYVVVTGIDSARVRFHDPALGPDREQDLDRFTRAWRAADSWSLVVTPAPGTRPEEAAEPRAEEPPDGRSEAPAGRRPPASPPAPCDSLVEAGIQAAGSGRRAAAESLFARARTRCPQASRPLRETAGLRFQDGRWSEAARLAAGAVSRDPADTLAWKLLAASRFMADDRPGALAAWNAVGRPRVDLLRIEGLRRTRYPVLLRYLGVPPQSLLTPSLLRRTERRLAAFPAVSASAVRYRPGAGGLARVEAAVVERPEWPARPAAVLGTAAHAAGARELRLAVTAPTGNGERLSGAWRWTAERPLIGLRLRAPGPRGVGGLVTVEGFRERQDYRPAEGGTRSVVRARGGLAWSEWITGGLRLGGGIAYDRWRDEGGRASLGVGVETRTGGDRFRARLALDAWSGRTTFGAARVDGTVAPLPPRGRFELALRGGFHAAGSGAPLSLVPGAGTGRARRPLLRAHPLLDRGVLTGPVFGRRLVHATVEGTWWPLRLFPARLGAAAFVDAARAWDSPLTGGNPPGRMDAGIGLRLGLPGRGNLLRLDAAWGLDGRAHAITLAATPWRFS